MRGRITGQWHRGDRDRPRRAGRAAGAKSDLWKVVQPDAQQGPLHRPHAHDHARQAGLEGLRPGDLPAGGQPGAPGQPYTYATDGFEATAYTLATDQFGTQFDPPAHWAPEQAAIDEVPASYSVRPLVVINTAAAGQEGPEVLPHGRRRRAWEQRHGRIPAGSVVMVRSDWSKRWTDDPVRRKELAADGNFPSVGAGHAEVPAPQAPHPVPRPRAARHRHARRRSRASTG